MSLSERNDRRIGSAILGGVLLVLCLLVGGGSASAQVPTPLQRASPVPRKFAAILRPISIDPDAAIVRDYVARNYARLRESRCPTQDIDLAAIFVGRSQIAPGPEPQILFLLAKPDDCERNGVAGYAITKEGELWIELVDLVGYVRDGFGYVEIAMEPIQARLRSPQSDASDISTVVQPENDGRGTIVWYENGVFWNGKSWYNYCWSSTRPDSGRLQPGVSARKSRPTMSVP